MLTIAIAFLAGLAVGAFAVAAALVVAYRPDPDEEEIGEARADLAAYGTALLVRYPDGSAHRVDPMLAEIRLRATGDGL